MEIAVLLGQRQVGGRHSKGVRHRAVMKRAIKAGRCGALFTFTSPASGASKAPKSMDEWINDFI